MAVVPVLRLISAEMARRVPGLRVEYTVAGAGSRQGAPALIWELAGGPITCGGFPVGDPGSRTLAIRNVRVVAELRARDTSPGTTDRDLEAAEELLRHLACALDLVAPADYELDEDWSAQRGAGASGGACVAVRVGVVLRIKLQADPWGSVPVEHTSASGDLA